MGGAPGHHSLVMTHQHHAFAEVLLCCASSLWWSPARNNLRQDLFGLVVLEVSVRDQSAPLLGTWGDAEHHPGGRVKQLASWRAEHWQRQNRKEPKAKYSLPRPVPVTYFFCLDPTSKVSASSITPPNHEPISELIHSLKQSPCDPTTSQELIHQLETKVSCMSFWRHLLFLTYDKACTKPSSE